MAAGQVFYRNLSYIFAAALVGGPAPRSVAWSFETKRTQGTNFLLVRWLTAPA
jgi:hypothetical protein